MFIAGSPTITHARRLDARRRRLAPPPAGEPGWPCSPGAGAGRAGRG